MTVRTNLVEVSASKKEELVVNYLRTGPKLRSEIDAGIPELSTSQIDKALRSLLSQEKIVALPGQATGRRGPPSKTYALKSDDVSQEHAGERLSSKFIMQFLQDNDWGTVADIQAASDLTYNAIWLSANDLDERGLIKRIGTRRSDHGIESVLYALTSKIEAGEVPSNVGTLLSNNEEKILNAVRQHGPILPTEIARYLSITDLKVIMRNLNNLMLMGYVETRDTGYDKVMKKHLQKVHQYYIASK